MARLPVVQANTAIAVMFPISVVFYMALFTTDPLTTGAGTEVSGGGYARQPLMFAGPSDGSSISGPAYPTQTFPNVPALPGGVPYFGLYTAATGGNYTGGGTTTGLGNAIPAGATITFAQGQVSVTVA
jgi:hypothetical protein